MSEGYVKNILYKLSFLNKSAHNKGDEHRDR